MQTITLNADNGVIVFSADAIKYAYYKKDINKTEIYFKGEENKFIAIDSDVTQYIIKAINAIKF